MSSRLIEIITAQDAAVRDVLSLEPPVRPARVVVRLRPRATV
jgi:hypothetical protein